TTGASRFVDESRNSVALGIDLHDKLDAQAVVLAKEDQSIKDGFPILVAGKIVVGDEKFMDALREVRTEQSFHIVGVTMPRPPPLDVDDGAKAALEWAAAAGIKGSFEHVAPEYVAWQDREHLAAEIGQLL